MEQQIRFCRSDDGVRIAYAKTGTGAPLIKVANWLSHLEYDRESPVWRHWLAELSREHTLIRYDERGCGLSDWDVTDFSFDAWLRDLEMVVDAVGVERFPLLGISQGAPIAIAYAVRHPERVSHIIVHGGYLRGWEKRTLTPAQREGFKVALKLIELGWGMDNPSFRQVFSMEFIPEGTLEQLRWFNELARVSTSAANAIRFMHTFFQIDVTELAPQVRCPTLVLHPSRDHVVPFDEGRLLASMVPGARFVPLESRNHLLLEHEPAWQRWVEEVRAFLPPVSRGVLAELTSRERELLELIARGRDNAQIAAALELAEKTVRNHITSIFAKLEVESRAQAIVMAREAGLGKRQ